MELTCLVINRPGFSSPLLRSARQLPNLPSEFGRGVRDSSAKLEGSVFRVRSCEGPWFNWDVRDRTCELQLTLDTERAAFICRGSSQNVTHITG